MSTQSHLIKKYNVPGPRYTSYPTVPYWEDSPNETQWVQALRSAIVDARKQHTGAAIYAHIPFCESLCTYCGCNTRITRNHGVARPYVDTVLKEFNLYLERLGADCVGQNKKLLLTELHLGGGTPTFLSLDEMRHFLGNLLERCELTPDHELSIEVDPRVTSREQLALLAHFGFKRISLGVQDFDPKVQDIVHRVQSFEQVKTITDQARDLGFTSVNYDLIYGLPLQTLQSVEDTIAQVVTLKPDRIAFYAYAHVPWIKPGQRRFTENDLPAGDDKRMLYERGRALLEAGGYVEIGMDHFALKTDSLYQASYQSHTLHRNFMGYTARNVSPIIALGVSSIGDAWTAFAQNEKHLETYSARVDKGEIPIYRGHILNDEDLILRRHILNLMTAMQTDWSASNMHTPFLQGLGARLQELQADKLVQINGNHARVTENGRAFLRNICMAFDSRLAKKAPETRLFSQTV